MFVRRRHMSPADFCRGRCAHAYRQLVLKKRSGRPFTGRNIGFRDPKRVLSGGSRLPRDGFQIM